MHFFCRDVDANANFPIAAHGEQGQGGKFADFQPKGGIVIRGGRHLQAVGVINLRVGVIGLVLDGEQGLRLNLSGDQQE